MKPEFFEIEDYSDPFIKRLRDNEIKTGEWVLLCRDPESGEYWQVDEWDRYRVPLAIRIEDPENWEQFDDTPIRVKFLIDSRGSLGEGECRWEGCTRKRLKGMAFCPNCALEKMGVEK